MRRFTDGVYGETAMRSLAYRVLRGRRSWHNRVFTSRQSIEPLPDGGFQVRWPRHGELRTHALEALPRVGTAACILASGPSVSGLEEPERMFQTPTACVNGSADLAAELGVRVPYYFVTDYTFILQKPGLFAKCVACSDAVILNPMSLFAAMATTPGVLDHANVYLKDDLRRPFKRPRPTRGVLESDPDVLMHPTRDIGFSLKPAAGAFPGGTVVYDAVQVLFGQGYTDLFMFGVDLTSGGRFYQERSPSPTHLEDSFDRVILPAFELVQEYGRRTGLRLTNCSPGSRLPASVIPKEDGNVVLERLCSAPQLVR